MKKLIYDASMNGEIWYAQQKKSACSFVICHLRTYEVVCIAQQAPERELYYQMNAGKFHTL